MRRSIWGATLVAAALGVAAAAPVGASAAVGSITEALASPDWSHATIAGAVTWGGCELEQPKEPEPPKEEGEEELPPPDSPPLRCDWTPFLTVGPGACSAPGRQPEALGPGIVLAWEGSRSASAVTLPFEVSAVPLSGGTEQIACLGLIEEATAFPWHAKVSRALASAVLVSEPRVRPCLCPPPGHRQRHHRHAKHRHHRIWVSQRQEVPKS